MGDAISDMLMVEAALLLQNMTPEDVSAHFDGCPEYTTHDTHDTHIRETSTFATQTQTNTHVLQTPVSFEAAALLW